MPNYLLFLGVNKRLKELNSNQLLIRDVFSVFSRVGQNFDTKFSKNHKKSLFFKIRGGDAPAPPNDVPVTNVRKGGMNHKR